MKAVTYRLLAVLAFALTTAGASLHAQICVPDPSLTAPGIYPATLPPVCVGTPYSEVITFIVPFDTTVTVPPFGTFTLPIDSITLDDVLNLPPGMSYGCSPATCSFLGNSSNCILFSGTPTVPGTYDIRVAVTAYVTFIGSPIAAADTISLYAFVVGAGITDTLAAVGDCGLGVGTATVSTNGPAPFTYLWSNGQTGPVATGLAAGLHSLDITDGYGCRDTLDIVVANDGAPSLETDTADFSGCFGDAGGFVEITVSGGVAPYTYAWSNGSQNSNLIGVPAGSYTVTASDARGCTVMGAYLIVEPAEVVVGLDSAGAVSCYGLADGTAAVTATGGTGALSYVWNTVPAQTGNVATGLAAGTYTVTATDGTGCTDLLDVVVGSPDSLALTLDATHETLAGAADGTATVTATGGTGSIAYTWSNGESGASIDSLAPGTYTVEAMDENGCITMDSVVIEVGPVSIEGRLEAGFASVRLFPNPAQDLLSLHIVLEDRDDLVISLADVSGRVLRVQSLVRTDRYEATWDMSAYAAGSYLLSIQSARGARIHRRVVLR